MHTKDFRSKAGGMGSVLVVLYNILLVSRLYMHVYAAKFSTHRTSLTVHVLCPNDVANNANHVLSFINILSSPPKLLRLPR